MLFNGYIKVKLSTPASIGAGGFPVKSSKLPEYSAIIPCRYKSPKFQEDYSSKTLKPESYKILVHANTFSENFSGVPATIALFSTDDILILEKAVITFQKLNLVQKIEITV